MNDERRELVAQIVTAGRRKLFGTPDLCHPDEPGGSPPCIGATGKENWLFHKLLDIVESHARRFGKPHVRASYEALGALSESEWAKDVAAERMPANVNAHRGPLTNADVLQEARRNWEMGIKGRSEAEVDVVFNRSTIPAKVRFVLGSDDGVVWLSTATSAFINRRWEELTSEAGRYDSALQVHPSPAASEYVEQAQEFARAADRVGDSRTAAAVRRGIWKRYKARILAWATVVGSVVVASSVVVTYAQSRTFRVAVRDKLPGVARVLDAITSQAPRDSAPPPVRPKKTRSTVPANYRIVELGDPVATEEINVEEDRAHPLRYDEASPTLPILLRKGANVEPQIVVTRSATNPHQAVIRAFLGDLWRGRVDSFFLEFDDGDVLWFEGNFIENLAGRYRGFMFTKTFSKGGTHEVSLMAMLKSGGGNEIQALQKRFNLDSQLVARPEQQPVAIVAPYEPRDEDVLPERDGLFLLVYNEAAPGAQLLKRDANGRVVSQIVTTVLWDGRVVCKVFLGPEFDDVGEVGIFEPDGSVHLVVRIDDYSRKYRGVAIAFSVKTPGPQTLRVRAVVHGYLGVDSEPVVSTTFTPPVAD